MASAVDGPSQLGVDLRRGSQIGQQAGRLPHPPTALPVEDFMSRTRLTRERLPLAGAVLRGAVAGIFRAVVTRLLDHLT